MDTPLEGSVTLLLIFAAVALIFSFLCSIAEAVLLSVSPSYPDSIKETNPKGAERLARLKTNIDQPLAAILTLNTIAHTVGAIGVGAEAGRIWGSIGVAVASGIMTFLVLVASEIIPKTIGAQYWRQLATSTAFALEILIKLIYPVVWMAELTTRLFTKPEADPVTRDEVAAVAEMSRQSGELKGVENRILNNLLQLRSLKVQDIMTPRTVIIAAPQSMTVDEFMKENKQLPVSRIPIYEESIDHVTGFALKSDILLAQANGENKKTLEKLKRELRAIPATASLSTIFEHFMERRDHLALVVDEYGGTDGLVSMEDLIETLLGIEIVDEADQAVDMQRLARQHWERRAKNLRIAPKERIEEQDGTA
ncbi:MAG: hemolysin family protein [Pseudomonadota bacterium]